MKRTRVLAGRPAEALCPELPGRCPARQASAGRPAERARRGLPRAARMVAAHQGQRVPRREWAVVVVLPARVAVLPAVAALPARVAVLPARVVALPARVVALPAQVAARARAEQRRR